jgi:Plavaka transposase
MVKVQGNILNARGEPVVKELELFHRNPIECVWELLGNPAFRDHIHYAPEHIYGDVSCSERIYNDMWTADWWWDLQVGFTLSQPYHR